MSSSIAAVDRLLQRSLDAAAAGAGGFSPSEHPAAGIRALGAAGQGARRFDLAILPVPGASIDVASLAVALGVSIADVATALRRPGGYILRDLDPAAVKRFDQRIGAVQGVHLELSEPQAATYDLFGKVEPSVQRDLERLGLVGCLVTGATAVALDCGTADWLRRRHGKLALDRRFQRFDVVLDDPAQVMRGRIADFIGLRAGLARSALMKLPPTSPIRLETGLKRAAACQFSVDYAAIGLNVELRLTGAM